MWALWKCRGDVGAMEDQECTCFRQQDGSVAEAMGADGKTEAGQVEEIIVKLMAGLLEL